MNTKEFKDFFPVKKEFGKLAMSEGWYLIHEFTFDDVVVAPAAETVTAQVTANAPSVDVKVMVAVPFATAVTTPPVTVATASSLEVQTPV